MNGFTQAAIFEGDLYEIRLMVNPSHEFDGWFKAWSCDNEKYIRVCGCNGLLTFVDEHED